MMIDRRLLGGALATTLLLAACGGSASQAPGSASAATAAPGATQPAASEPAASQPTEDTPEPSSAFQPSLAPGTAGDLEAKLPSEVNGVKFQKSSFDGNSIPGGIPIGDSDLEKLLQASGRSLQDVRVAIAAPTDTAGTNAGNLVMAIQVKGVDSSELESWAASQLGDSGAAKTTVGGKSVYGGGAAGLGGAYFYVKDDVVYYVLSLGANSMAEGILQQLP